MTAALSEPTVPPATGPATGPGDVRPVLEPVDGGVPDADLSVDELGSRIVGLAGRLAAATCRWLLLVAQFDARAGHDRFGLPSTARWLSHTCGIAHRTAIDQVRTGRALAAHPALRAAMTAGRISYTHARAISRIADGSDAGGPLVADLIDVAVNGTAEHLETVVRGLRTVDRNAGETPSPQEYVRTAWTSQSRWGLTARLDPERGAVVQRALEQLARAEGVTLAEALVLMAENTLTALADSGALPRPMRGDERAAVIVHLDAADVVAPETEPEPQPGPRSAERAAGPGTRREERPMARVAGGPGLPRRVVERLLCECRVRTVLRDHERGEVLDVGRSRRFVTDRQYRALLIRHDGHCAHPGCRSTRRLHAHHVRHWLHGGRTDLANLVLLCEAHHLAHHDGEYSIAPQGRGRFRFLRRDGRELEHVVDPRPLADRATALEDEHPVPATAARTAWTGERLARAYAVSVLAERRRPRWAHLL